jgi:2-iminobutanoate/2-iminopropanoate deaminase
VIAEGRFLFVSGQGPYSPQTGKYERGTIEQQTELTLNNVKAIVAAAGGKMENVVSCRVFLQPLDTQTFAAMNGVYATFFGPNPPVRTTVGCQLLNIDVEIDCIVAM